MCEILMLEIIFNFSLLPAQLICDRNYKLCDKDHKSVIIMTVIDIQQTTLSVSADDAVIVSRSTSTTVASAISRALEFLQGIVQILQTYLWKGGNFCNR